MPPILMILLLLAVVYFLTMRKKKKQEDKKPERPKFSPIPVTVEEGCWSCTPEELLDNVSLATYQTGTMALPAYIYGAGYVPQDKRHWVTLTASEEGKLTEVVITWCLDDEQDIRKGASNYAGTFLAVLANEECDQIIWEINRLTSQHEQGIHDELTRYSPNSRVYVSVGDDEKRIITIVISPITPGELANYRAEKEAQAAIKAAQEAEAKAKTKE
ncbi:hypothetical protein CE91St43_13890 [Oscillospiraceae bacterium]|nr:hypothetical protein CE91St43_13890 [Oscillospiraceae bacterium]